MRARRAILVAGLLAAYAWFYQAGGWNQNSRLDLVRAIVEQGTLRIDAFHANTEDKARRGGHVYSDKAPGLALAATPLAFAARPFLTAPGSRAYVRELSYTLTVLCAGVPTALAALLLLGVARRLGAGEGGASVAGLVFGLATPAWAYATLFFGHALATFGLVAALAAAVALADEEGAPPAPRRDRLLGAGVGLGGGWAAITEYPCAIPALALAGLALANVWRAGGPRRRRVALGVVIGGVVPALAVAGYNLAAFGSVVDAGYAHVEGFRGMREGVMGVTWPRPERLWGITGSPFRGLFFHAPVLLAGVAGFPLLVRAGGLARRVGLVAGAIVAYFLLFNASYHYWDGGWSYGPRHLAPALPFLCLPLAVLWTRAPAPLRVAVATLALVSMTVSLVAVATTVQPPNDLRRPFVELQWPAFRDGRLGLNDQSFLERDASPETTDVSRWREGAWNLGTWAGLRGRASLLPLLAVWLGLAVAAWRAGPRRQRSIR